MSMCARVSTVFNIIICIRRADPQPKYNVLAYVGLVQAMPRFESHSPHPASNELIVLCVQAGLSR